MSLAHPEASDLEAYAIGLSEGLPIEAIESHLRMCPGCTEQLRSQAQLEFALAELAERVGFCPGCQGVLETSRCPRCGAIGRVRGFEVREVLISNAHGRMYRVRDAGGRELALKELAFVQPPHPEALAAFEREVRLLGQLAHPQIPRFVDSFSEGEGVNTRLYLAQEFVEGESLQVRLGRHQFAEEVVREIARQVLDILVYLQSLSPMVFHRDIKPGNLILQPDGRVALVDFGAARDMGSTVGATLVGTFGYMPTEQLGGIVDATTDLYALGATLAHLLGRREPWKLLDDPGGIDRLNVSPGFRRFLGKLLARRPEDRFASAVEAAQALRRVGWRRGWSWLPVPRLPTAAGVLSAVAVGSLVAAGLLAFRAKVHRDSSSKHQQTVLPKGGLPERQQVQSEASPDTGFELISDPPGQLVWLDGQPFTGADPGGPQARTDLRASRVPPGRHVLEIKGDPRFKLWHHEFFQEPAKIMIIRGTLESESSRGGTGAATSPPRRPTETRLSEPIPMISRADGSGQLAIDPSQDPYRPRLPATLPPGHSEWALLEVCVSEQGVVTEVKFMRPPTAHDAELAIRKAVLHWRYRPLLRDGKPTPFCAPVRLELRGS